MGAIDIPVTARLRLTNQTPSARYGFPVLHCTDDGRDYGPADTLPPPKAPHIAAMFHPRPSLPPQTAGEFIRSWMGQRNPDRASLMDEHDSGNTDWTTPENVAWLEKMRPGESSRTPEEIEAAKLFLSQLGGAV